MRPFIQVCDANDTIQLIKVDRIVGLEVTNNTLFISVVDGEVITIEGPGIQLLYREIRDELTGGDFNKYQIDPNTGLMSAVAGK